VSKKRVQNSIGKKTRTTTQCKTLNKKPRDIKSVDIKYRGENDLIFVLGTDELLAVFVELLDLSSFFVRD
jgi:hypothetical protein